VSHTKYERKSIYAALFMLEGLDRLIGTVKVFALTASPSFDLLDEIKLARFNSTCIGPSVYHGSTAHSAAETVNSVYRTCSCVHFCNKGVCEHVVFILKLTRSFVREQDREFFCKEEGWQTIESRQSSREGLEISTWIANLLLRTFFFIIRFNNVSLKISFLY